VAAEGHDNHPLRAVLEALPDVTLLGGTPHASTAQATPWPLPYSAGGAAPIGNLLIPTPPPQGPGALGLFRYGSSVLPC
jgi:hypothetical protein